MIHSKVRVVPLPIGPVSLNIVLRFMHAIILHVLVDSVHDYMPWCKNVVIIAIVVT